MYTTPTPRASPSLWFRSAVIRRVLERIVETLMAAGTVGGRGFAVDASLIAADVNKQRSIEVRTGAGRKGVIRQGSSADWLGSWPDRLQKTSLFPGSKVSHFADVEILPENRTFMQYPPAQRSGLILPCRDTERLRRTLHILWERGFAFRPGRDPKAQSLSRVYDYFFFEVFFATFLVAAFAVFFAFFAFLAMSSSVKNWLSEHAHAAYRHAQH
jgi:hypothetical protein